MTQACLKCLKYIMCGTNLLCFMCGIAVLAFGIYMTAVGKMSGVTLSLAGLDLAHVLIISGIIITCVSFLGFLGALRENRCLLLAFFLLLFIMMLVELTAACLLLLYEEQIGELLQKDLNERLIKTKGHTDDSQSLNKWDVQKVLKCCGINNISDWEGNVPSSCCKERCDTQSATYYTQGCFEKLKMLFEENFLFTGIGVILLCVVEVLAMCFAMTLFCHISRSGLGYKL